MGYRRPLVTAGAVVSAAGCAAAVWSFAVRKRAAVEAGRMRLTETLPVHSAWWRDTAKHEGDILYVAIGDSAAQGIGASTPENSYVGIIAGHLRSVTGRSVRVVNLSVSGATVALAVADQLPRFTGYEPGVVTVSIGANDITDFDPDVFRTGIQRVLEALPGDALIADLPYFFLPKNERKVAVANAILRKEAATRGDGRPPPRDDAPPGAARHLHPVRRRPLPPERPWLPRVGVGVPPGGHDTGGEEVPTATTGRNGIDAGRANGKGGQRAASGGSAKLNA